MIEVMGRRTVRGHEPETKNMATVDRALFQVGKKIVVKHARRAAGQWVWSTHEAAISEVLSDRCFYQIEGVAQNGGFSFEALERGLVQVEFV